MRPRNRRFPGGLILVFVLMTIVAGGALALAGRPAANQQPVYNGQKVARCVPKQLNVSNVLPGTGIAVSPLPGSYDASPGTQISFLGVSTRRIADITVSGSITGEHSGRLETYSQGDGGSFLPDTSFRPGETVTVSGHIATASGSRAFSFQFTVAYPDPLPYAKSPPASHAALPTGSVQIFHSAPALQPPTITVSTDSAGVAPGDIFLAPYSGPGHNGPMIANQQGQLVWMDPLIGEMKATNLQVESYEGKPVLTWWQGYIPPQGFGLGEEIVANTSYRQILHIKAGNGEMVDLHDFHLEPNHTAVFTVFHTIHCDLVSVGGPTDAALTDSLLQELDITTGLVRREWTSADHVALGESYSEASKASVQWPFDFFHLNSIDPRSDGTTLLSSRNTSALWIINTKTGEVLAKAGGRKSTVKMGAGAATAFQHDAMTLPDGQISIFDNGGSPFNESYSETKSRGVIISLNLKTGSDALVQELKHAGPLTAGSQGDVQQMPNGSWFVGWGQEPYFSEYNPAGTLIYDAHMWAVKENKALETQSYRTYKFPWHATPYWPPSIVAQRNRGEMKVWASWNGATEVASWRLLGGSSTESLQTLATTAKTGFETTLKAAYTPYVEAQALNSTGTVIGNTEIIKG